MKKWTGVFIAATISIMLIGSITSAQSGALEAPLRTFEDTPEYSQPFATILGTMTNASWYQSASIGRDFGFYIGLPLSITYVGKKDRSYEETWVDEDCEFCHEQQAMLEDSGCQDVQTFSAPTIFGDDETVSIRVVSALGMDGSVVQMREKYFSGGITELSNINWLPFATLQLGLSLFHTELKLRYIGVPLDVFYLHLPGVGIQHDLASIFPDLPISISLAANFTFMTAGWSPPDDNIEGTLELSGMSNFAGLLVGYKIGKLELFLEGGWEHSYLNTGGELNITVDNVSETITPDVKLVGRNTFRIGLNLGIALGYNAVVGHNFGSDMSTNINILGFRYPRADKKED